MHDLLGTLKSMFNVLVSP